MFAKVRLPPELKVAFFSNPTVSSVADVMKFCDVTVPVKVTEAAPELAPVNPLTSIAPVIATDPSTASVLKPFRVRSTRFPILLETSMVPMPLDSNKDPLAPTEVIVPPG